MDIDLSEITIIRIRLEIDEMQDLLKGERLFADLDRALQLEIYHSSMPSYPSTPYLNGDHEEEK